MEKLAKLVVESSKIKTDIAQKYLNDHNNFIAWPSTGEYWIVENYPESWKTIKIDDYLSEINKTVSNQKSLTTTPGYLGRELAKIIKQNEELFCEMEYLLRGTHVDDVKSSITLMCQHLQCSDSIWTWSFSSTLHIVITEKTPLHLLGCVAKALHINNGQVVIVASNITAPICHLFVNLCLQVGWSIPLIFAHNAEELFNKWPEKDILGYTNNERGCTAVVTEQADVDSALDALINSSTKAEWSLRRIFLQESVYEEFKTGLAWKCERIQVERCVDAFTAQGKSFLCDRLHNSRIEGTIEIGVEAYRTAKELISLMKKYNTPYLSVWAEGSALSHEIALAGPADYVWVNDYATFHGPPQASLPVYEGIYHKIRSTVSHSVFDRPECKIWRDLKDNERKDIILNALKVAKVDDDIYNYILNWHRDTFVCVNDGMICSGVAHPYDGENVTYNVSEIYDDNDLIKVLNCILCGNIVVYTEVTYDCNYDHSGVVELLEKSGVPVLADAAPPPLKDIYERVFINNKLKVVHTRFGTIFAN